eukprot:4218885-Pyramimonas_sp.AAC.1
MTGPPSTSASGAIPLPATPCEVASRESDSRKYELRDGSTSIGRNVEEPRVGHFPLKRPSGGARRR